METMKSFTEIKLEKDGPLAILTLHRPDKMNAFTGRMMQELIEAFDITDTAQLIAQAPAQPGILPEHLDCVVTPTDGGDVGQGRQHAPAQ